MRRSGMRVRCPKPDPDRPRPRRGIHRGSGTAAPAEEPAGQILRWMKRVFIRRLDDVDLGQLTALIRAGAAMMRRETRVYRRVSRQISDIRQDSRRDRWTRFRRGVCARSSLVGCRAQILPLIPLKPPRYGCSTWIFRRKIFREQIDHNSGEPRSLFSCVLPQVIDLLNDRVPSQFEIGAQSANLFRSCHKVFYGFSHRSTLSK